MDNLSKVVFLGCSGDWLDDIGELLFFNQYKVFLFDDVISCIECINNNQISVIIIDVNVIEKKDHVFGSIIDNCKDNVNIQIIVLGDKIEVDKSIQYFTYTNFDYFIKPITKNGMLRCILKAVEKKNLLDKVDFLQNKIDKIIETKNEETEKTNYKFEKLANEGFNIEQKFNSIKEELKKAKNIF